MAPNNLNLDGIFGVVSNVVWTTLGPCAVEDFERTRLGLRRKGPVQVLGVDKFPRMTDYVLPTGVRIADADRVRLGAHLAEGTTVMHEGFVNYNAGTLGSSMVEGRISAGVVVGDGSDVGGGASIMGTLSGGGTQRVAIGRRCLLGANAGVGISLGDDCVVEAGAYVTAGSKITLPDGAVVKALELSGQGRLAVPAQQCHRRARGAPPQRDGHRTERRVARQHLIVAVRRSRAALGIVVTLALALLIAIAVGARFLYRTAKTHLVADDCTVGAYDLEPSQASVAAAMVGEVGQFRVKLPFRASLLVLMAGLQESKLTNIPSGDGDRDSVGVLQQRPSQGWGGGKASVLTDVGEATREFLEALVQVPHWMSLQPAVAIQKVQISADGSAYAQHEPQARVIGDAIAGRKAAGISCSFATPTVVATSSKVAQLVKGDLGIDTPRAAGRTVRVPGAGWQTSGVVRGQRRPPRHQRGVLQPDELDALERLETQLRHEGAGRRDPLRPEEGLTATAPGRIAAQASLVVLDGRQLLDPRRVVLDLADLRRAARGAELVEVVDVGLGVVAPLVRQVVLVEDRLDRAHRLAGAAVDALVGVDVEHPPALVDAVDRALLDAGLVEQIHTRLGNHVGHCAPPSRLHRVHRGGTRSAPADTVRHCPHLVCRSWSNRRGWGSG